MFTRLADQVKVLRPWLKKGSWTILDQALFAGSNFVLNILLVRWLTPEAYGAFAVGFTVFLLLGALHTGLLTEPMLVFGPTRFTRHWAAYLALLLRGHLLFALACGLGLALAGWAFRQAGYGLMGTVLLALAWSQFGILFLWLLRRACYALLKPQWAALAGLGYAVLLLGSTWFWFSAGRLSAAAALGLMAGASVLAGAGLMWQFRVPLRRRPDPRLTRVVIRRHWHYGRWASATGALQWIPGQVAFLILPLYAGLAASGALKALLNLILPIVHIYGALAVLLLPVFAKARAAGTFGQTVRAALALVLLATGVYWVLLGWLGAPLMQLLYGGQYLAYAPLLWWVGALPFMAGIGSILRTTLRALERPDHVFWAYLASSGTALTAGLALIMAYGLRGALVSFIVQMLVELGLMWHSFRAYRPTQRKVGSLTTVLSDAP